MPHPSIDNVRVDVRKKCAERVSQSLTLAARWFVPAAVVLTLLPSVTALASDVVGDTPAASMALAKTLYATPGSSVAVSIVPAPTVIATPIATASSPGSTATSHASNSAASSIGEAATTVAGSVAPPPDQVKDEPMKLSDKLLIGFTGLLAVFTGLLWFSTRALWKETQRGGKTAEVAADAAQKSAIAAEKSAAAALAGVNASIAAQQPRWLLDDMHLEIRPNNPRFHDPSCRVVVTMKHLGNTASELSRVILDYAVVSHLAPQPTYTNRNADPATNGTGLGVVVAPNHTQQFTATVELGHQQVEGLIDETLKLFVYGVLVYRDFLDRRFEKGFIAELNARETNFYPENSLNEASEGPFVQPSQGVPADAYVYTREQGSTA